jgi:acetylornithine deacetylase
MIPGPTFQAVSDAPYLIAAGVPTAILGPGSLDEAHTAHESLAIDELVDAVDRYERIVRAFLGRAASDRLASPIPAFVQPS